MVVIFAVPILRGLLRARRAQSRRLPRLHGAVAIWALILKAFWAADLHVPLRKLGMTGIDETAVAEGLARE